LKKGNAFGMWQCGAGEGREHAQNAAYLPVAARLTFLAVSLYAQKKKRLEAIL
jgi:hypothetical protein